MSPPTAHCGNGPCRPRAILIALTVAAWVMLTAPHARAQQHTFYLDRIQISGSPDDGFVAWRPYLHEKTRFYGSLGLGYTLNPLRSETLADNPNVQEAIEDPVDHQLTTYLMAGAEFVGRVGVGLSLPIGLIQSGGRDPQSEEVGNGIARQHVSPHDIRLTGRVRAYQSDNRKLQVGAGVAIWFPTGNSVSFAGDDETSGYLFGAAEYDFGKFQVAGQLGPHFRPDRGILGSEGVLEVGSELRWAGTVFFPMRQGTLRLGGSLWGTTGIQEGRELGESTFFNGRNTDLEWLAEARVLLDKKSNISFNGGGGTRLSGGYGAPDIRLLAMIGIWSTLADFGPKQTSRRRRDAPDVEMHDRDTDGDGYPDDIDLCPTVKEDGKPPRTDDGCPAIKDRDGDGIPDDVDKCPDEPEDRDGILDGDGCPEKDADNDGIPDGEDACPLVPGIKHKDPKKNGCPKEPPKIAVDEGGIKLLEPIQFDTGKSTIKQVSFEVLDQVVDVLNARTSVRMGVYGHTDSQGAAAMNRQLSKDRAASVVRYLVTKGIAANRLESNGFGPDQPLATNDTEEGKAKNRRVEFKALE